MKQTFLYQGETINLIDDNTCKKCMFPKSDCHKILIQRDKKALEHPADHLCNKNGKYGFFSRVVGLDNITLLAIETIKHFDGKKFKNIRVKISIKGFKVEPELCITVFDKESDNVSFFFYGFQDKAETANKLLETILIIEKDDFELLKGYDA